MSSIVADATKTLFHDVDRGLKATAKVSRRYASKNMSNWGIVKNLDVAKTADSWAPLSQILIVPHTETEYRQLVELLDSLVDEVGEDESHPLASFMEVVGVLIEKYEDEYVPESSIE